MKTVLKIGGLVLVLVALIAAAGVGYAAAQRQTDAAAASYTASVLNDDFGTYLAAFNSPEHRRPDLGIIDRQSIVAAALGISVDELQAAHDAGKRLPDLVDELGLDMETVLADIRAGVEAAIQQAVTDGTLTQAQADRILEQIEMRALAHELIDRQALVADALGITVEELEAARVEGKTVADLAAEQGLDMTAVRTAIQAGREAVIEQALNDGTITQEQADWLLSRSGAGMGPRGRGHWRGHFPGAVPPPNDVTIPTDSA